MRFTSGINCGRGSFAVHFGDHLRSGDHFRSGIICGAVQIQRTGCSSRSIIKVMGGGGGAAKYKKIHAMPVAQEKMIH